MLDKQKLESGVYGFAVGDALGVPVEFCTREYLKAHPIKDRMIGYGTHNQPVGTWSDDTSMVLATMDVMSSRGLSMGSIMDAFVNWLRKDRYTATGSVFDVGGTTYNAIINYLRGESPEDCGLCDEMSNGNGSLMRMLPMIYYVYLKYGVDPFPMAVDAIYRLSGLTHAHIVSKVCCTYYVYIGIYIMEYGYQRGLQQAIRDGIKAVDEYYKNLLKQYPNSVEGSITGRGLSECLDLPENEIKSTGYVVDSLEASLWCLYHTGSYKEAVVRAVNLGGDTDTIGAITGSLAGIYYGEKAIPIDWLANLRGRDKIKAVVDRFYDEYK